MDINLPWLFAGLVFSIIGFAYFRYGKKQAHVPMMVDGVILIAFSYFTDTWVTTAVVGSVLTALPFVLKWW